MTTKKATDEQLVESYKKTHNVWKTAKSFGMCGQTVYERLSKLGKIDKKNYLTEEDKNKIRTLYKEGFEVGDNKLELLSKKIKRTKPSICRFARKEGLTNTKRKCCDKTKQEMGIRAYKMIKEKGHPKGMLGKHHTEKVKKHLTETSKKNWRKKTQEEKENHIKKQILNRLKKRGTLTNNNRAKCSWKARWRKIGDKKIFLRSRWEANYARYLEYLKQNKRIIDWDYETQTFLFKNGREDRCFAYVPDFEILTKSRDVVFHEVKGWYDERSRIKIKKMRQEYPSITLKLIRERQYKKIKEKYANKIPNWEN